jgi:hypothetical protein
MTDYSTYQLKTSQLVFPATQVASADANTMDDYEEVGIILD